MKKERCKLVVEYGREKESKEKKRKKTKKRKKREEIDGKHRGMVDFRWLRARVCFYHIKL